MSIREKRENRWSVELSLHGETSAGPALVVNSIDGDPKSAKVSLLGKEVIVEVVDLIEMLKKIAANTSGIPAL